MGTLSKIILGLACACLLAFGIYSKGWHDRDLKASNDKAQELLQLNSEREEERAATQKVLNEISRNWQDYSTNSKAMAQRTIDMLRNDGIRLSVQLADSTVCNVTGSCRSVSNGNAELHPNTSRFLIEQAQRADEQVTALQQIVRRLQGEK
ncbi:hypothetical protein KJF94_15980 [Pseudomonas hormoni]|uniref:Lysis protein n=1 Tax=Pseudomonas hormoni TaxID=3093767 RepID=A0ABX8ERX2_9PSED|nr:hypothetical protein [Pseudomonas hormoni]QVW21412.1 hypothetical protein KJF94_15980 [Pseudomonas hormoni]